MATKHVGCVEDGCTSKHLARGYCSKHYYQRKWRGDFSDFRPKGNFGCQRLGCERDYYAKGYCKNDYMLFRKWGETFSSPRRLAI